VSRVRACVRRVGVQAAQHVCALGDICTYAHTHTHTHAVSHGNLTENSSPIFFAITLSVPLLAMYAYFLVWQTYM
jgi:hypothetical protein